MLPIHIERKEKAATQSRATAIADRIKKFNRLSKKTPSPSQTPPTDATGVDIIDALLFDPPPPLPESDPPLLARAFKTPSPKISGRHGSKKHNRAPSLPSTPNRKRLILKKDHGRHVSLDATHDETSDSQSMLMTNLDLALYKLSTETGQPSTPRAVVRPTRPSARASPITPKNSKRSSRASRTPSPLTRRATPISRKKPIGHHTKYSSFDESIIMDIADTATEDAGDDEHIDNAHNTPSKMLLNFQKHLATRNEQESKDARELQLKARRKRTLELRKQREQQRVAKEQVRSKMEKELRAQIEEKQRKRNLAALPLQMIRRQAQETKQQQQDGFDLRNEHPNDGAVAHDVQKQSPKRSQHRHRRSTMSVSDLAFTPVKQSLDDNSDAIMYSNPLLVNDAFSTANQVWERRQRQNADHNRKLRVMNKEALAVIRKRTANLELCKQFFDEAQINANRELIDGISNFDLLLSSVGPAFLENTRREARSLRTNLLKMQRILEADVNRSGIFKHPVDDLITHNFAVSNARVNAYRCGAVFYKHELYQVSLLNETASSKLYFTDSIRSRDSKSDDDDVDFDVSSIKLRASARGQVPPVPSQPLPESMRKQINSSHHNLFVGIVSPFHLPHYFSTRALPAFINGQFCLTLHVTFAVPHAPGIDYSKFTSNVKPGTTLDVNVTIGTPVKHIISKICWDLGLGDSDYAKNFIFRAPSTCEYMSGDALLMNFAHVRDHLVSIMPFMTSYFAGQGLQQNDERDALQVLLTPVPPSSQDEKAKERLLLLFEEEYVKLCFTRHVKALPDAGALRAVEDETKFQSNVNRVTGFLRPSFLYNAPDLEMESFPPFSTSHTSFDMFPVLTDNQRFGFNLYLSHISAMTATSIPKLDSSIGYIYFHGFFFCSQQCSSSWYSQLKPFNEALSPNTVLPLDEWLAFSTGGEEVPFELLPRETKFAVLLYGVKRNASRRSSIASTDSGEYEPSKLNIKQRVLLGWTTIPLFDESGLYTFGCGIEQTGKHQTGTQKLVMWVVPAVDAKHSGGSSSGGAKTDYQKKLHRRQEQSSDTEHTDDEDSYKKLRSPTDELQQLIFQGGYAPSGDDEDTLQLPALHIRYKCPAKPVFAPLGYVVPDISSLISTNSSGNVPIPQSITTLPKMARDRLDILAQRDILLPLSSSDKELVWTGRDYLKTLAIKSNSTVHAHQKDGLLPLILQCANWFKPSHRAIAQRVINDWPTAPITNATVLLQLLGPHFSAYFVRKQACNWLSKLPVPEVANILLQLTQCVKYEMYHDSPLVRCLLSFALSFPMQIGTALFYHCKVEIAEDSRMRERFSLIVEELLYYSPELTGILRKQEKFISSLNDVAYHIQKLVASPNTSESQVKATYQRLLHNVNVDVLNRSGHVYYPLDPRHRIHSIIVEECRYMSSKQVPLWIVVRTHDEFDPVDLDEQLLPSNPDETKVTIYKKKFLFKCGDDLRQDSLTLQLLNKMNDMWMAQGLDLRMTLYRVLAVTGQVGLIDAVEDAVTTATIQFEFGGGLKGALKKEPLLQFLQFHNLCGGSTTQFAKLPSSGSEAKTFAVKEHVRKKYLSAIDNFSRSCAGYIVSSYVLGLGDRHNSNIMVKRDGHMFHIDFGHFLGNFKTKYGINRERSPFVFTPQMAHVVKMGKSSNAHTANALWVHFCEDCFKAFTILRHHTSELEVLFVTMLSAGIPELLQASDIAYLRDMMLLHLSDEDATTRFHALIKQSETDYVRTLDNWAHLSKHF